MEPQNLNEFLDWVPDYPDAILGQGLMYTQTKTIIYGRYKSMKSMLAQRLALSIVRGEPWLGFQTPAEGASVFYMQSEIPHRQLQKRFQTMVQGRRDFKKPLTVWTEHSLKLDSKEGLSKLERKLEQNPSDVLIIDPIYKVLTGDMKEQGQISAFLDNMDALIDRHGVTIVLISHAKKAIQEEGEWGSDDLLGSVFFSAWPDSIFQVRRDHGLLTVKFEVLRHAEEEIPAVNITIDSRLQFDNNALQLKVK